jgi:indole-3-glycerol phosphate synthase
LKISESGISDPKTIKELRAAGFDGFLIGENFMKECDPGKAMEEFVKQL